MEEKELLGKKKRTRSQIGRSSRNKGKAFELALSKILTERGIPARRAVQFNGCFDHDLKTDIPFNFEAKAVESLNLYNAMDQSVADAKVTGFIPTVVHKKNNKAILITMEFQAWIDVLQYALGYVDSKNTAPLQEFREKYMAKKRLELDSEEL